MGGSSKGVLIMCMTALSMSLWLDSLDSSCKDSDFSIDKELEFRAMPVYEYSESSIVSWTVIE